MASEAGGQRPRAAGGLRALLTKRLYAGEKQDRLRGPGLGVPGGSSWVWPRRGDTRDSQVEQADRQRQSGEKVARP